MEKFTEYRLQDTGRRAKKRVEIVRLRTWSAWLSLEIPHTTHNALVASVTRDGRPFIRKSDKLKDAESRLMSAIEHAQRVQKRASERRLGSTGEALSVEVTWCFQDKTRTKTQVGKPYTRKPDMSNMLKTLEDCLTRAGVIEDDRLIVKESLRKAFDEREGILVTVEEFRI